MEMNIVWPQNTKGKPAPECHKVRPLVKVPRYFRKIKYRKKNTYIFSVNLKKLFKKLEMASTQDEKDKILSELQPVITYASIAMDECDFGTGLEIAIDLFCSGLKELEANALSSFNVAYMLLKREAFSKIIQVNIWKNDVYILYKVHSYYYMQIFGTRW